MRERLSVSSAFLRLFQTRLPLRIIRGILSAPRRLRRYLLFMVDSLIFLIATCIALNLRFEDLPLLDQLKHYQSALALVIPVKFCIFYLLGMYRPLLRHTGAEVLWLALKSVILSEAGLIAVGWLLEAEVLPRSVQIISALITWIGVVGVRFSVRRFLVLVDTAPKVAGNLPRLIPKFDQPAAQRIIIYGAGSAGFQLSQALMRESAYEVVAFVDDNPDIHGRLLDRIPIHNPVMLRTLIEQYQVKLVLLAVPSAKPHEKRRILRTLKGLPVKVKTVPSVREIVTDRVSIGQIRNVDIADLLGREEILPDPSLLRVNITDKSVLVTGAGGSIGSELCRQIAQQNPRLLVLYELNEFALYSIDAELAETFPEIPRKAHLGSVTDGDRLAELFQKYEVETVYHAAAYKHVPLVESNAAQGISTLR